MGGSPGFFHHLTAGACPPTPGSPTGPPTGPPTAPPQLCSLRRCGRVCAFILETRGPGFLSPGTADRPALPDGKQSPEQKAATSKGPARPCEPQLLSQRREQTDVGKAGTALPWDTLAQTVGNPRELLPAPGLSQRAAPLPSLWESSGRFCPEPAGWALNREKGKGASVCRPHTEGSGGRSLQRCLCIAVPALSPSCTHPSASPCHAVCPARLWCPVFKGADTRGSLVRITLGGNFPAGRISWGPVLPMGLGAACARRDS